MRHAENQLPLFALWVLNGVLKLLVDCDYLVADDLSSSYFTRIGRYLDLTRFEISLAKRQEKWLCQCSMRVSEHFGRAFFFLDSLEVT
jgi:hypothetical protein